MDGGGMRGLIPALVISELERRIADATGGPARIADYFHLLSGTSTGGLVALTLTTPDPEKPDTPKFSAQELARLYQEDGPKIFGWSLHRVLSLNGSLGPKYPSSGLRRAVANRIGDVRLREALREVVVTSYDMHGREPFFFKRWRARESPDRDVPMLDAALATSAAPTYFPSHRLGDRALVDGGIYVNNPTIAAIVEALKRRSDDPHTLTPDELLVVSLGTGSHEEGFPQSRVRRWGKLGWILPHGGGPPLLDAVLDGESDAADHWAHVLLNAEPGAGPPEADEIGRGPRYYRLQVQLASALAMDATGSDALGSLADAARKLIDDRQPELDAIVARLAAAGPIPYGHPGSDS